MAFNSLRLSQTPATFSSGKKALWKDAIIKCLCKWMEKRKFAICFKQNAFPKKNNKKGKQQQQQQQQRECQFSINPHIKVQEEQKTHILFILPLFSQYMCTFIAIFRYVSLRLFHSTSLSQATTLILDILRIYENTKCRVYATEVIYTRPRPYLPPQNP